MHFTVRIYKKLTEDAHNRLNIRSMTTAIDRGQAEYGNAICESGDHH